MANRFRVLVDDVLQKEIKLEADLAGLPEGSHVIKVESYQDSQLLGSDTRNITVPSSGGGTDPDPDPSGDFYQNAVGVYSLRKVIDDYSGPAIRIRREGETDAEGTDINFSGGDLDTAAITSFADGGITYVTTFYNQKGGLNATQSDLTRQGRITHASGALIIKNGKPTLDGAGVVYTLNTGTLGNTGLNAVSGEQFSILNVFHGTSGSIIAKAASSGDRMFQIYVTSSPNTPTYRVRGGTASTDWGLNDENVHALLTTWDGSTMMASYDNEEEMEISDIGSDNGETDILLGGRPDSSADWAGGYPETIIWDTSKESVKQELINDVKNYWGI